RIAALRRFRDLSKDFEGLALASKRIMNIVKGFEGAKRVNPDYFENKSEENLWKTFQSVKDKTKKEIDRENYLEALNLMAILSGPINEFFSQVMVMTEDKRIRENRLGMLTGLNRFFLQIADFSRFAV
ncbi:MAG: DALR anticodon-binding domain-containing protein, partial [Desulfatiglandales bacterium]